MRLGINEQVLVLAVVEVPVEDLYEFPASSSSSMSRNSVSS